MANATQLKKLSSNVSVQTPRKINYIRMIFLTKEVLGFKESPEPSELFGSNDILDKCCKLGAEAKNHGLSIHPHHQASEYIDNVNDVKYSFEEIIVSLHHTQKIAYKAGTVTETIDAVRAFLLNKFNQILDSCPSENAAGLFCYHPHTELIGKPVYWEYGNMPMVDYRYSN